MLRYVEIVGVEMSLELPDLPLRKTMAMFPTLSSHIVQQNFATNSCLFICGKMGSSSISGFSMALFDYRRIPNMEELGITSNITGLVSQITYRKPCFFLMFFFWGGTAIYSRGFLQIFPGSNSGKNKKLTTSMIHCILEI
jgi:hypothetical protein